ncbi:MAG: TIGR04086 family membrane protein [Acutalibacteraceae bacterium]|jgi:putative membrane protein (TIGR04086 family)
MKESKDNADKTARIIRALGIGTVAGTLVCLAGLLIMAAVLTARDMPQSVVTPLAVIAAAFGALVGGFIAARVARGRGLLMGALTGALLYLLILLAGTIWFRDALGVGLLVKLAVLVVCGGVGGILGVNLRKR